MNDKDKKKMLRRLSQAPQTAQYFQSEKALEDFIQNKLGLEIDGLNLPSSKISDGKLRMDHSRISGMSRMSGLDSSLHNNKSRLSQQAFRTHSRISQMSRMSTQSRISHRESSFRDFTPTEKRKSRTHEIATTLVPRPK